MGFPEEVKYRAVDEYLHTHDVTHAIAVVQNEYNITISERSVYGWVKNPKYNTVDQRQGALFSQSEINVTIKPPAPGGPAVKFDQEKFKKVFQTVFSTENKELNRLVLEVLKEFNPSKNPKRKTEIQEMSLQELVLLLTRIKRLFMHEYDFVVDSLMKSGSGNVEDVIQAMEAAIASIPEGNAEQNEGSGT